MRVIVLHQELVILRADGGEPAPHEIAAFCLHFMVGSALGQLHHVGASEEEIRFTIENAMTEQHATTDAPEKPS